MKFTKELTNKAKDYLSKKLGKQPEEDSVNEFLSNIAKLGELFLKNVSKIEKDI